MHHISPSPTLPRLILHVGTPKTGTTSLQYFLRNNYEHLREQGVLYPLSVLTHQRPPKHQWMMSDLIQADAAGFTTRVSSALAESDARIHTVILSTEGIYNHWWDYPTGTRDLLKVLTNTFLSVSVLVVFREPLSFALSLYKQALKNPARPSAKCYGQDWTFERMLEDPWFRKHLDYAGFIEEVEAIFGPDTVDALRYEDGDTIDRVMSLLGIARESDWAIPERENVSLSGLSVEILRVINRIPLDAERKRQVVASVEEIGTLIGDTGDISVPNTARDAVEQASARSRAFLKSRYDIRW